MCNAVQSTSTYYTNIIHYICKSCNYTDLTFNFVRKIIHTILCDVENMCHIFFSIFFSVIINCLLIVELWSIISPHYVYNYVMSRARFLVNLTKFINAVSQLIPSWQQPFNTLNHLSHFPGNSSDSKQRFIYNKVEIHSLVSTVNIIQEHNSNNKKMKY